MARPTRIRERPKLLVDLSEKVSEDLQIDLTPAPPGLAAGPQMSASLGLSKAKLAKVGLARVGLGSAAVGTATARERARLHKPPPALAAKIAMKVRRMFPDDREFIFAISHWCESSVGQPWRNECDYMFWVGAEHHAIQAVYEWMNSEYEAISDQFGYDGTESIPLEDGLKAWLSIEQVLQAWDDVANDQPEALVTGIDVMDSSDVPADSITMTAGQVMGHLGISREDLIPYLILADSVLPADHAALYSDCGDAEVYLDEGYVVTAVEEGDEYTCIHINPA